MKRYFLLLSGIMLTLVVLAQSPQKFSYQAVVRDGDGKLIQNKPVGIRISVLEGSTSGPVVYMETHEVATNINGLITLELGAGTTSESFSDINWSAFPHFLKTETDPTGGTSYTMTTVSQFLSVPYALYAKAAGTILPGPTQLVIITSLTWIVPPSVTNINVELWGASGGGGGAGAFSEPYSYNMNKGGYGGSGGFATQEMDVEPEQEFAVVIGEPGAAGMNATSYGVGWHFDTGGEAGSESRFGEMKAAGGGGGKKGSYAAATVHGNAGTNNIGEITGHSDEPNSNILDVFQGLERSYIADRVLTSRPGKGGSLLTPYSYSNIPPTDGEGGCAIITFFE
ncbi:MAG: hypothetical protein H8D88_01400 [Bacteroidetes bacterium]|nr:hypothetical protein [Bacteroidota bacterium]